MDASSNSSEASKSLPASIYRYTAAAVLIWTIIIAMYRAKAHGRARYELFDSQMYTSAMLLLNMEVDLRNTIKQEEFQVHYQPVVSVLSGTITGVEALVRWNHPKKGYIPPMEFIPLAEETGLISNISEYVLKTACAQHLEWKAAGYPGLLMKVNFSACPFYHNKILDLINKILRETGMNAKSLDIEVTESIATEERSIAILKEISDMGIHISIDDFGTGYSSLGALNRLPINTLKIDKSFIRDIVFDPNARAIVRAIIAMGHNLKIKVLAEGVETKEQLEFLQINKCDEVQGFFFSQPVNNKDLINLLKRKTHVI